MNRFSFIIILIVAFSNILMANEPDTILAHIASNLSNKLSIKEPSKYLIYDDLTEDSPLSEKWINGGKKFLDNATKLEIEASLSKFNADHKAENLKLYVYVGRYFVDYDRFSGDQSRDFIDSKNLDFLEDKLKNNLKKGLNAVNGNAPLTVQSAQFDPKTFTKYVDEYYKQVTKNGEKTLVLFYVETIKVHSSLNSQGVISPVFNYNYYSFVWGNDESSIGKERESTFLDFMKKGYSESGYAFDASRPVTNIENDVVRRNKLKSYINGISAFWGKQGDEYLDPYGFRELEKLEDAKRPIWAKGYNLSAIKKGILEELTLSRINLFGGFFDYGTEEQRKIEEKRAEAATIIILQEFWVSQNMQNLGTITIGSVIAINVEDLIPVWSSGKRAYLYTDVGKTAKNKWDILDKQFINAGFVVLDCIPMGKVSALKYFTALGAKLANRVAGLCANITLSSIRRTSVSRYIVYFAVSAQTLLPRTLEQTFARVGTGAATEFVITKADDVTKAISTTYNGLIEAGFTKVSEKAVGFVQTKIVDHVDNYISSTLDIQSQIKGINSSVNLATFTKGSESIYAVIIQSNVKQNLAFTVLRGQLEIPFIENLPQSKPSDDSEREKNCKICNRVERPTCVLMEDVYQKAESNGSLKAHNDAMIKICSSSLSDASIKELMIQMKGFNWSNKEVSKFLIDISLSDKESDIGFGANINNLNIDYLNAWKFVFKEFPGIKYHRDIEVLKSLIKARSSLSDDGLLKNLMNSNRALCKSCDNPAFDQQYAYRNYMSDYLLDVVYFVNTFFNPTKAGYNKVMEQLQKPEINPLNSAQLNPDVDGAVFILQVLRQEKNIGKYKAENIYAFEIQYGNVNRYADIQLQDGTLIDGKSWKLSTILTNFKRGNVKFNQFLDYIRFVPSMDKLEYWFNASKDGILENNVKETFSQTIFFNKSSSTLTNEGLDLFEAIWGNVALKNNLWKPVDYPNGITQADAKIIFSSWISNASSSLYKFITVK